MDIKNLSLEGAWTEFDAESEKIGKIKLLLSPMAPDELVEIDNLIQEKDESGLYHKAMSYIEDWDLQEDGKKYPCTDKNKTEITSFLMRVRVKPKGESSVPGVQNPRLLCVQIIAFVQNMGNFVKN